MSSDDFNSDIFGDSIIKNTTFTGEDAKPTTKLISYFSIGTIKKKPDTHVLMTIHCHHIPMSKEEFKKQTVVNVINGYHIMMENVPIEEYKERKRLRLPILICDKNPDFCREQYLPIDMFGVLK